MSWFSTIFNKVLGTKTDSAFRTQENAGKAEDQYGLDLTNEGLGSLRDLATKYQGEINAGGLPSDLRRQFSVLRGSLSDNAVRTNRAYLANLRQKMLTSPTFRPEAAAEYDVQNQQNIGEGLFNATNNANMDEAQLALTNTNALRDRIDKIRTTVLGVGQDERSRALQRILTSIGGRNASDASFRSFVASLVSSFTGGGATGGGLTAGG